MLAELPHFGPFLLEHPKNIIANLIGLALLAILLWRFAVPGLVTMLHGRASSIDTGIQQVERQLIDVATLRSDYANRIKTIEVEQRERIAAAVRDAEEARISIISDAQQAARAVRQHGEEELDREHSRQRILFRQQLVQITLDAAEEAVRAQNSDAVQRQLIHNFVSQIARSGEPIPKPEQNISSVQTVPSSPAPTTVDFTAMSTLPERGEA